MDTRRLRIALVERGERLVDLHRATGISYNRLVRLVNGYCPPRPGELAVIASRLGLPASALGDELASPTKDAGDA